MTNQVILEGEAIFDARSKDGGDWRVADVLIGVPRSNGKGKDDITVKAWDDLAGVVADIRKGQSVKVKGSITNRKYKNKDDVWVSDVHVLAREVSVSESQDDIPF